MPAPVTYPSGGALEIYRTNSGGAEVILVTCGWSDPHDHLRAGDVDHAITAVVGNWRSGRPGRCRRKPSMIEGPDTSWTPLTGCRSPGPPARISDVDAGVFTAGEQRPDDLLGAGVDLGVRPEQLNTGDRAHSGCPVGLHDDLAGHTWTGRPLPTVPV